MKAKKGSSVKVEYTGSLETGQVFDTSEGKDPLEFKVGEGKVIKGFDDAVVDMDAGEEKEISIKAEDAYGQRNEQLVQEVPKQAFGESTSKLQQGIILGLRDPQGNVMNALVTKISDDKVTLDMNHPLAGKNLKFKIKMVEVK